MRGSLADTELYHQIRIWQRIGVEVHIIRPWLTDDANAIAGRKKMEQEGIIFHNNQDWKSIDNMPCISYCSAGALDALTKIRDHTDMFIFVNCMTWLFPKEVAGVKSGLITHEIYQRESIMADLLPQLCVLNTDVVGHTVKPYFDESIFPEHDRSLPEHKNAYRFGKISRNDASKFHNNVVWIYENIVSPQDRKEGLMLGVNDKVLKKIGSVPNWIRHVEAGRIGQQEFYRFASFLINPCDTNHNENLPRVAFEAMASNTLLIVDDKGGWQDQIIHGETGWLCKTPKEFVYYSSRAAFEFEETQKMRKKAREYLIDNWGEEATKQGWKNYFQEIGIL